MRFTVLAVAAAVGVFAQAEEVAGARIRAHVKFLASDLLEGRGVGTRGELLATEYLAAQFALVGAKPAGDNGTYFQKVTLVGATTGENAQLRAGSKSFRWLDEFVGVSQRQKDLSELDADAIFVGHGITAPEFGWDDYKGVNVRDKVLVMFTNEPPSTDPKFFGGPALTYYGRWTYKFEEALRKGAAGAIIIHTTPTAGYGWEVVRNSWGREDSQVKLEAGEPALAFNGWVTREAGEKLLSEAGQTVDALLSAADKPDFRPVPLGIRIRGRFPTKLRTIETRNVAAVVEGSDPKLKSEAVVFSAHWDHLGIGTPVDGDAIYNGAVDNATGCGMLIEMARAFASLSRKPRRSALYLAVTAEEGGLRGSEFYASHPVFPLGKTALNLNFDAFYPFGRTRDIVTNGAERTTAWPLVEEAARRFGLTIRPDPRPEQGSYYRSDHFSLAKAGVPAFSINGGTDFLGRPAGAGEKIFADYNTKSYHRPSDQYQEDWDFAGMEEVARFGVVVGMAAANLDRLPTWVKGDEFLPVREASGVK
jgi:Zn-dependent M28 family amino/carboxypeptidase